MYLLDLPKLSIVLTVYVHAHSCIYMYTCMHYTHRFRFYSCGFQKESPY